MADTRPTPIQYVAYVYGRRLPDSMRSWVANDLAGSGAVRRHMIRMAIPPLLVLAPFWLLPASLYVHLEMTAPIYMPIIATPKAWTLGLAQPARGEPILVEAETVAVFVNTRL